jgi:hypothetical protein
MTNNEKELLTLIRESENKEQALITAVLLIGYALEHTVQRQQQTVPAQLGGDQRELA